MKMRILFALSLVALAVVSSSCEKEQEEDIYAGLSGRMTNSTLIEEIERSGVRFEKEADGSVDMNKEVNRTVAAGVTRLNILFRDGESLADISYLANLKDLECYVNVVGRLDLSYNKQLATLDVSFMYPESTLNITQNALLETLIFDGAIDLKLSLDLSGNPALKLLNCQKNTLRTLDLSHNTQLEELNCRGCDLAQLDLSRNTLLHTISCGGNPLKALVFADHKRLETLDCSSCELTSLDLSSARVLRELICWNNKLERLDLRENVLLEDVRCESNLLTELDVRGCNRLIRINCPANRLLELDLSQTPLLESINCVNNRLSQLDVTKCSGQLYNLLCGKQNFLDGTEGQQLALTLTSQQYPFWKYISSSFDNKGVTATVKD